MPQLDSLSGFDQVGFTIGVIFIFYFLLSLLYVEDISLGLLLLSFPIKDNIELYVFLIVLLLSISFIIVSFIYLLIDFFLSTWAILKKIKSYFILFITRK